VKPFQPGSRSPIDYPKADRAMITFYRDDDSRTSKRETLLDTRKIGITELFSRTPSRLKKTIIRSS